MKEKLLPTDATIKVLQDIQPIVSSYLCLEKVPPSISDCLVLLCKFWGFTFSLKLLPNIKQKLIKWQGGLELNDL